LGLSPKAAFSAHGKIARSVAICVNDPLSAAANNVMFTDIACRGSQKNDIAPRACDAVAPESWRLSATPLCSRFAQHQRGPRRRTKTT
jgi:hypothetical protein